jgi:Rieske Fe-S protein
MNSFPDSECTRRGWVKRFILGTAVSLTAPRWAATLLANPLPGPPGPAVLRLEAADYPSLASIGGSLQLVFIDETHPFTLNRVSATRFVTLDSICTHQGCVVGRYQAVHSYMRCPCHQSRFDIEGRVFRNASGNSTEPAPSDLKQFATTYDVATGIIAITIPDLALAVHSLKVIQRNGTGNLRLKLDFPVTAKAKYEIRHHASLDDAFTVIPFSTTANGTANQNVLAPAASGNASVYVDASGSKGFFVVALKLSPY